MEPISKTLFFAGATVAAHPVAAFAGLGAAIFGGFKLSRWQDKRRLEKAVEQVIDRACERRPNAEHLFDSEEDYQRAVLAQLEANGHGLQAHLLREQLRRAS